LGRAIARRLLNAGWAVDVAARDRSRIPHDLATKGVRFFAMDRHDDAAVGRIVGNGTDFLVDALCYTSADARQLIPLLRNVTSVVMLSSKAVYVDENGRHINSEQTPQFPSPIREDQPTVAPGNSDFNSPEGYGATKSPLNARCSSRKLRSFLSLSG
jgi:nucleoside-diphosphate-sugar epimerase